MAPNLRPRTSKVKPESYSTAITETRNPTPFTSTPTTPSPQNDTSNSTPPTYTINLSLPPAQRYVAVANVYRNEVQNLRHLFDQLLDAAHLPKRLIHFLTRILLRKVCSKEQTEELRGISQAVEIPMYLLVAYNVLLDLFMGCTSGGARVQTTEDSEASTMMHFRTLDWDMSELRDVIVQLDYVRQAGGHVIARTVSYVGFVGVLTGLKKGLSVSLNFRPYHNGDDSMVVNMRYYFQQLAVLLGWKPSVASILRDFIVPRTRMGKGRETMEHGCEVDDQPLYGQGDVCNRLPMVRSTAAYLIFCTPDEAIILEKDRRTGKIQKSSDFIAVTNHDASYDTQHDADHTEASHAAHAKTAMMGIGMEDLVDESIDRKRCLVEKWESWSHNQTQYWRRRKITSAERDGGVPLEELKLWMQAYPTSNEQTHFVCIMDPAEGAIRWVKRYAESDIGSDSEEFESDMEST